MTGGNLILGETASFWLALKHERECKGEIDHLREIFELRAKVSFYEDRIKVLAEFMGRFKNENL